MSAKLDFGLAKSMARVSGIIQAVYPKILAEIANDIFASGGQSHGRHWAPNTPSTIRNKGGNSPNIEGGQLEDWLSTPGNLVDDDYMSKLPTPKRTKRSGSQKHQTSYSYLNNYEYANDLRPFDDIGRTADDDEFLSDKLAEEIQLGHKEG